MQGNPMGASCAGINFFSSFDIEIKHRNGKQNAAADFLSRHPINLVHKLTIDDQLKDIYKKLMLKSIASKVYLIIDDQLYYRKHAGILKVITTEQDLKTLLQFLHDQFGHSSLQAIYTWINTRFYRPHLYRDVKHYIDSCHTCQINSKRKPSYNFTGSLGVSGLFLSWSIDFLGPFTPSASGHKYIFVAVEHLSRYPIIAACTSVTASTATNLILLHIIAQFGTPANLYVDKGTAFTAHLFSEFTATWNINTIFTPPGVHQLNAFAERMCGTVRLQLTRSVNSNWTNWDSYLPGIALGLRSRPSHATGKSPFSVLYGFEPLLPFEPSAIPSRINLALRLIENSTLPGLRSVLSKPTLSNDSSQFQLHSLVLVQRDPHRKKSKQLSSFTGPFRIIEVFPHNQYSLVSVTGQVKMFHGSRLIHYHPRTPDVFLEGGNVG